LDLGASTVGIVQQGTDNLKAFVSLPPLLIRDLNKLDALRPNWRLWAPPFGPELSNLDRSGLPRLDVLDQDRLQIDHLRDTKTLLPDADIGARLQMKTAFHIVAPQVF
jgi:hypothetical protein